MIEKTVYVAPNGKEFTDPIECKEYEEQLVKDVFSALSLIKDMCNNNGLDCETCPFCSHEHITCKILETICDEDGVAYSPNEWT